MSTVLPIDAVLDDLRAALESHDNALLIAQPGAGKTTRVPLALLEEAWLAGKKILMLEPRRVAARNAATFMARQLNEQAGETVGYRMRLENRVSAQTRIEVVTEGILNRVLLDDPELTDVGLIIFDEFHERNLASDQGLALCLQAQQVFNPELKLLVMSATLDALELAKLLNAPVIESDGRSFAVETHYRPARDANERLVPHVCRVIGEALRDTEGDILVFLPGAGEITRVQDSLIESTRDIRITPLHGQLNDKEQKQALNPDDNGQRKVILATNIAESSVTIDGVRVVIDCGLEKRVRFRAALGMQELVTQDISVASAVQRAGRAGRQAPGVCYRLFTETSMQQRPAHIRPEINDADLAPLLLDLVQWGASADELDWLTPPPKGHLSQAQDLLSMLGILEDQQLSDHGKRSLTTGLEPRLANMLIRGIDAGFGQSASTLAAFLQEPALLRQGDDIERLMQQARGSSRWKSRVAPVAQRLMQKLNIQKDRSPADTGFLLGCAFPDRIGQKRGADTQYLLASGAGAALADDSALLGQPLLACADIAAGQPNRIRTAATLSEQALSQLTKLHPHMLSRHIDVRWLDNGQLQAQEQQRLGKLILSAKKLDTMTADDWQQAWRDLILAKGLKVLNWDDSATNLLSRLRLAHECQPERWPDVSDEALLTALDDWLMPFLTSARHQRDLKKLNLSDALLSQLEWDQQQGLASLVPTHITVPSGSNIRIDYRQNPPVLAVKLQEMFGFEGQPAILNGQLPLMIHLLSPAQRPLQVTQDLPHFWRHTYADVRKDMRGRYPKHPWPEDPLSAEATRFTKRRPEP
ncbi:ATP-dependent helicase HrpB [Thalassolituus sp. UBA2590]|uniref:ATP-dependent helicase HrpB n=1 Tax=Thalassolituus sp. UBA2590 TaxID=1947663 RepID=UPI0026483790|nr:ATP-dependent helicase HrpB [Thalassolituus sp. UBA2590]